MKKNFVYSMLLVIMFTGILGFSSYVENTYSKQAVIVEQVNEETFIAEDSTGNLWEFYADELCVGDVVRLTFDANHTDNNIYDDKIKDIKIIDE